MKFAANTPSARKSLANLDAIQPANKVLNGEQLTRSVIKALNAQNFKLEYSHGNYAAVEKQINQDFDAKIWNETRAGPDRAEPGVLPMIASTPQAIGAEPLRHVERSVCTR